MEHPIVRTATRIVALAGVTVLLGAGLVAPAGAQSGQVEVRLESTGAVTAYLHAQGTQLGPLPTNTEHPYGWSGEGVFTIQGAGTCRIVADGSVVAESPGPVADCRWP